MNKPSYEKVDLTTINNGAALELFEQEFEKVMLNINDPSINSDADRKIVLTFKVKPNKDRNSAVTTIEASSKLISNQHQSSIFVSNNNAFVTNPKQEIFEFKQGQEKKDGE